MRAFIADPCLWCGRDTTQEGYVNRVPAYKDGKDGYMCGLCGALCDQERDRDIADLWPQGIASLESVSDPQYVLDLLAMEHGIHSTVYSQAIEFFDKQEESK